ncbi:cytochrome P450 [Nemania abortiva]|nr:cytochrome P450 [Nemania abortiva]
MAFLTSVDWTEVLPLSFLVLACLILVAFAPPPLQQKPHGGVFLSVPSLAVIGISAIKKIRNRASAWRYLIHGQSIIQREFDNAHNEPFEIFAPDNRYVFVSSEKHIKEVDSAPDTVLSLQAASKQMLQPAYTMHGFNWFDRRGTEGVGFVRALRVLLTNNLPQILPTLSCIVRARFEQLHSEHAKVNGEVHSPVYPMIIQLVVLSNALSFFGEELAKNEAFMIAALSYVEETLICAEIVRLVPKFMAPFVGKMLASRLKCQKIIYSALLPVAEERCLERDYKKLGHSVPDHADCIQWIMQTSPSQKPWTPERIVHELIAIWFGSVHALSTTITFAIHDLCLHPEYVTPLREELAHGLDNFEQTGKGLALLDSFIKESARLSPVESMSTRRAALKPFTLSDGTSVGVGDWLCTPVRALMQSGSHYPDPLEFNGFRFVDPSTITESAKVSKSFQEKPSRLVDVDNTFHVWGTGRMACPGRYYAAAIMKLILGQIIMKYECRLVDSLAPRHITWRSTMIPRQKTMVVFTPH